VTEGECVTVKMILTQSYAGSFHHFVVPLPPGGRLLVKRISGGGAPYAIVEHSMHLKMLASKVPF